MAKTNERLCRGYNNPFLNCSGKKDESEYYVSWSKFDNGKTCYCKKCIGKIYDYYLNEFQDTKSALYFTCAKVDVPFRKDVYEALLNKREQDGRTAIHFGNYIRELQKLSNKKEILTDFSATNFDLNELPTTTKSVEEKKKELEEYKFKWGVQDSIEDYEFLEYTYYRYTEGKKGLSTGEEDWYRDLSRDRLLLRKINNGTYNGDETIDKIQSRINRTMVNLKIDKVKEEKPMSLSEQSIFAKIQMIERTMPADLYKEPTKYQDYNKQRKYYKDLVLRPLLNTLCGNKDFDIDIDDIEQYGGE